MNDYFDIYGTPIKFSSIKEFRIVQKEYIYRPVFMETVVNEQKLLKTTTYKKYVFHEMRPYAAILDENDRRGVFSNIKASTFKESIGKEILGDIRETVGDKFNIKAIKGKKYKCTNETGRVFSVYLDEIPALFVSVEGKFVDVTTDNPMYWELGETILPAINLVHALVIKADQVYTFYGNGIQVENIYEEYKRLQYELSLYNHEKKEQKKLFSKGKTEALESKGHETSKEIKSLPKISLPNFKCVDKTAQNTENEIAEIKKLYLDGNITAEEYNEKIQKIIDSI